MHIGNAIYNELKRQGRTVVWFANELHLDRSTVYNIFERESVDTNLLARISIALKHNFFTVIENDVRNEIIK